MDKENSSLKKMTNDDETYVIEMTDEGAFYITKESDGLAISPLFTSEFGSRKWLQYQIVNQMLEHRVYQFGMDCLMYLEGEYFWQNDLEENLVGPIFTDYDKAIQWRWKQKR